MARYRFAHAQGAQPKCLEDAGIRMPNCRAVVILTVDDEVNLRIASMARLLNPDIRILCRSTSKRHIEHLGSLGNVTVINPFESSRNC